MKLYGKLDEEAITDISCNLKAFEEYDDVYYTTKEAVSIYDVYIPFEKNLDADWLPYNYSNGNMYSEDITELVTEDEFLEKFKKWYLSD